VTQDQDLHILAAALLASSPSQPNSLIVTRYNSQNTTTRDHAMIT
jgi:hypothetical protein